MAVPYSSSFDVTIPFSDVTTPMALRAGTSLSVTVPGTNARSLQVEITYNNEATVFVGYNQDLTIPAQDTATAGRFIELKPGKRYVKGGDVLYFRTPDPIAYIGVAFRSLPG